MKKLIILMSSLLLAFTLGSCSNGLSAYPHEEVDIAFMQDFFENVEIYPYLNTKNSVYGKLIIVLSYLDAVQNDNIIPEEYEKTGTIDEPPLANFLYGAGWYNTDYYSKEDFFEYAQTSWFEPDLLSDFIFLRASTYEEYCELDFSILDYEELLSSYYGDDALVGVTYTTCDTLGDYVTFIKESIDSGVPVIIEADSGQTAIAYSYTSSDIILWYSNYTKSDLSGKTALNAYSLTKFLSIYDDTSISKVAQITLEDTKHYCSDNFYIYEEYICGCVYKEKYYFYD